MFNAIGGGTCNPYDHPAGHYPPQAPDLKIYALVAQGQDRSSHNLLRVGFNLLQGPLKPLPLCALNLPATDLVLQDPKCTVLWDSQ